MIRILKNRLLKGIVSRHIDRAVCSEIESSGRELSRQIKKKFGRSLSIRQVDTGSCGGCESEIVSANNPIYDLQRFGISFVASPRHADALLVTGPVSKNMLLALQKTFGAMPEPKFVIALGDCALNGGLFQDSYYVAGPVKKVLPVVLQIPGCPPDPLTIVRALSCFLRSY